MVGNKADEEDCQEAEDAAVGLAGDAAVVETNPAVRLINLAGNGGVAKGEDQQRDPEQRYAEEGGHLMPLHTQRCLQIHALPIVLFIGRLARQNNIGQGGDEERAPGEKCQNPGEANALQKLQHRHTTKPGPAGGQGGGGGVSHNLDIALQADEAHEEDPHVHG